MAGRATPELQVMTITEMESHEGRFTPPAILRTLEADSEAGLSLIRVRRPDERREDEKTHRIPLKRRCPQ